MRGLSTVLIVLAIVFAASGAANAALIGAGPYYNDTVPSTFNLTTGNGAAGTNVDWTATPGSSSGGAVQKNVTTHLLTFTSGTVYVGVPNNTTGFNSTTTVSWTDGPTGNVSNSKANMANGGTTSNTLEFIAADPGAGNQGILQFIASNGGNGAGVVLTASMGGSTVDTHAFTSAEFKKPVLFTYTYSGGPLKIDMTNRTDIGSYAVLQSASLNVVTPEPGTMALLAVGGIGALLRRRK